MFPVLIRGCPDVIAPPLMEAGCNGCNAAKNGCSLCAVGGVDIDDDVLLRSTPAKSPRRPLLLDCAG